MEKKQSAGVADNDQWIDEYDRVRKAREYSMALGILTKHLGKQARTWLNEAGEILRANGRTVDATDTFTAKSLRKIAITRLRHLKAIRPSTDARVRAAQAHEEAKMCVTLETFSALADLKDLKTKVANACEPGLASELVLAGVSLGIAHAKTQWEKERLAEVLERDHAAVKGRSRGGVGRHAAYEKHKQDVLGRAKQLATEPNQRRYKLAERLFNEFRKPQVEAIVKWLRGWVKSGDLPTLPP